jgi:multidrug efflux pump subunit AcrA (membrane-fusion protein)
VEDAQLALQRTTITAPFDAVVRSETVDVGSFVSPGQTLAQLYASDLFEVVVPLSQDDAALLPSLWSLEAGRNGRQIPAQVTTEYGPYRYAWNGYVDRAETALDPATRTVDAVIRVPRPFTGGSLISGPAVDAAEGVVAQSPPLLVGAFVDASLEGPQLDRYAVVPRRALRQDNTVWAVERDSILRILPVQVLQRTGGDVLLASDRLEAGQPLVTSDLSAVTDGMTVRLASEQNARSATSGQ